MATERPFVPFKVWYSADGGNNHYNATAVVVKLTVHRTPADQADGKISFDENAVATVSFRGKLFHSWKDLARGMADALPSHSVSAGTQPDHLVYFTDLYTKVRPVADLATHVPLPLRWSQPTTHTGKRRRSTY